MLLRTTPKALGAGEAAEVGVRARVKAGGFREVEILGEVREVREVGEVGEVGEGARASFLR